MFRYPVAAAMTPSMSTHPSPLDEALEIADHLCMLKCQQLIYVSHVSVSKRPILKA